MMDDSYEKVRAELIAEIDERERAWTAQTDELKASNTRQFRSIRAQMGTQSKGINTIVQLLSGDLSDPDDNGIKGILQAQSATMRQQGQQMTDLVARLIDCESMAAKALEKAGDAHTTADTAKDRADEAHEEIGTLKTEVSKKQATWPGWLGGGGLVAVLELVRRLITGDFSG